MRTIRGHLAILILAAILPLLVLGGGLGWFAYQHFVDGREQETERLAAANAEQIASFLDQRKAALAVLSRSPAFETDNLAALWQAMESVERVLDAKLFLSDPQGNQLLNTLAPFGAPLPIRSDLSSMRRAIETGKPSVSDLFMGKVAGNLRIAVDIAVLKEGVARYVVGLGVDAVAIQALLEHLPSPPGWVSGVVDGQGIFIARTLDPGTSVGKRAAPAVLEAIRQSADGIGLVHNTSIEGFPILTVFHRVPGTAWTVLAGVPESVLYRPVRWALGAVLGVSLLALAIAVAFAVLLGRRVNDAASRLVASAEAMGRGETPYFTSTLMEFNTIGAGMRLAAVTIREREAALSASHDAERMARLQAEKAEREAAQANAAKSDFLAKMSHEIRTPLNGIIGMSELALLHARSPKVREYVELSKGAAWQLAVLINDILDLAKIEAGRMEIAHTPFSLHRMVEATLAPLQPLAGKRGLRLSAAIEEGVPEAVVGDAARLGQVLTNLIGNGIKFTPAGSVTLSVRREGTDVHFAVADTGIGIPEDERTRIFESFVQAGSATHARYGGTGLGLAIAHHLVVMMGGGPIQVESAVGEGSRFSFSLPLCSETTHADAAPEHAATSD